MFQKSLVALAVAVLGASAAHAVTYELHIRKDGLPSGKVVQQYSGYRAWSDDSLAASCNEYRTGKVDYAYRGATGDGVYRIDVDGAGPLPAADVLCDMTTDGGGWTVFQYRFDGSVDFYLTWVEYANGFGNASGEYWLGNDRLATLTATPRAMRIELMRTTGETGYASYSSFKINPASDNYRLTVSGYSGTRGDSLASHNGRQFSTYDADHDVDGGNCAVRFHGAWWYNNCHSSNLNGAYLNGPHTTYADGVEWSAWTGQFESLARTVMKVR